MSECCCEEKKGGSIIAIATMFALYGMVSFVTNLAAPMGNVWILQKGIEGSTTLGMMGNMMNFAAYLFMGIPAGRMLNVVGYKKTASIAIATGLVGVIVQWASGLVPFAEDGNAIIPFCVYLLGAFICGFSVCMLNTVINPMLNLIGGGGNRGNQLNLIGGTFNSVCGTATPIFVGILIGEVTKKTMLADVNPVMYIAMAVFTVAFIVLQFLKIEDPKGGTTTEHIPALSPLKFRHCLLGVIGIFVYVGIEVGVPGTLLLWLNKSINEVKLVAGMDAVTAGCIAGTYWFLMLCGRIVGAALGSKVSSRAMMLLTAGVGVCLLVAGSLSQLYMPMTVSMPVFTGKAFVMANGVPLAALLFAMLGLCTSIMWPCVFNLATEGLGKYTAAASGLFMVMVVGGGLLPIVQNLLADGLGGDTSAIMISFIVPTLGLVYLFLYALVGSKNVNKDIKVD